MAYVRETMTDEKETRPISLKSRLYASLIFLIIFVVIVTIWTIFFSPDFQPNENLVTLLIFFLVFAGLAMLPWLPLLFPREPPGGPPLEDL